MNASNDDTTRQQAQDWSSQLGTLAAALQLGKPQTDFAQLGFEAAPAHGTRMAGLLGRHLHRNSP
jgi:hypothetical protein